MLRSVVLTVPGVPRRVGRMVLTAKVPEVVDSTDDRVTEACWRAEERGRWMEAGSDSVSVQAFLRQRSRLRTCRISRNLEAGNHQDP